MAALNWAASLVLPVLVFLSLVFTTRSAPDAVIDIEEPEVTVNDLKSVLGAIEKLLQYFKDNVATLNLDGFFGLRVLEGHLQLLMQEQKAGLHNTVPSSIWKRITQLSKAAAAVSESGQDFVRKDDSKYFEDFIQVVEKPWAVLKQPRNLNPSLRWEIPQYKAKLDVHLTEELSDRCLKEVMNASYSSVCVITDECAKIMTTRGLTGYGITHQLLWSILAEMSPSCDLNLKTIMKKHNMVNVNELQLEMCTNNFYEMIAIVHVLMKGMIDESHQDLFLEQQFVCPSLGFYEFLKKDYLRQILSWQFPCGCFGEKARGSEEYADDDKTSEVDVGPLLEHYHKFSGLKNDERSNENKFAHLFLNRNTDILKTDNIKRIALKSTQVPNSKVINDQKRLPVTQPVFPWVNHVKNQAHNSKSAIFNKIHDAQNDPSHLQPILKDRQNSVVKISLEKNIANLNVSGGKIQNVPNIVNFVMTPSLQEHQKTGASSQRRNFSHEEGLWSRTDYHGRRGRKLLVEKQLEGGCLSHKTGVGAGALVMYLQYFIKPGKIKWTGHHELFLSDTRNLLQAGNKAAHFQDMQKLDAAIADDRDEGEEEDEEDEEDLDDIEDEEEDEQEDDETAANYNEDEGWEVPGDFLKLRARNGENRDNYQDEYDQRGDVVINKDGKQHIIDYANLDDQEVGQKVKSELKVAGNNEEDEGHYYYDDANEFEKGIIKKRHPITARPYPPARVRRKHRNGGNIIYRHWDEEVLTVSTPNTSLLILVSITPFFLIVLFLIKFVRRRRIHLRYRL